MMKVKTIQRLNECYKKAQTIEFDDSDRIIFLVTFIVETTVCPMNLLTTKTYIIMP